MSEDGLLSVLSIEEYRLLSAVKVQDLWCPASSVTKRLGEFVSPIFELFPGEPYEIGSIRSCVRIQFANRYLVVATQHEFREKGTKKLVALDKVGLRSDTEESYLTPSCFYFAKEANAENLLDHHDLCFFDFTESVENGLFRRDKFINIERIGAIAQGERILAGAVYGYAFQDQVWEYDESGDLDFRLLHIGTKIRESVCTYLGKGLDVSTTKWEAKGSKNFDANGMSGGAAFALVGNSDAFEAKFIGLVVRGGNGIFYTINAESVVMYLNAIFPINS